MVRPGATLQKSFPPIELLKRRRERIETHVCLNFAGAGL
jgi:hypothetical protein